jgi:hypothetical protein
MGGFESTTSEGRRRAGEAVRTLLRGVWRDTSSVVLVFAVIFALVAADPANAQRVLDKLGMALPEDGLLRRLVVQGYLSATLVSSIPGIAVVSAAVRGLVLAFRAVVRRWRKDTGRADEADPAETSPLEHWVRVVFVGTGAALMASFLVMALIGTFSIQLSEGQFIGNVSFISVLLMATLWFSVRSVNRNVRAALALGTNAVTQEDRHV